MSLYIAVRRTQASAKRDGVHVQLRSHHLDSLHLEKAARLIALLRRQRRVAPQTFAAFAGRRHACAGAFADQRAFKLGKRRHDMEHQYSPARSGIDALIERSKLDTATAKSIHQLDEFAQRAPEPVEPPYDHRITRLGGFECGLEAWTGETCAGDPVVMKHPLAAGSLQSGDLQIEALVFC